jgi:cyclic lactone autoinducer peptide
MNTKKRVAEVIANVAFAIAKKACGAASVYGMHQSKEPTDLAKKLDKMSGKENCTKV